MTRRAFSAQPVSLAILALSALGIGSAPIAAGPYIPQGPFVIPRPCQATSGVGCVPSPQQVPGKEYAAGPNHSVPGPVASPGQSVQWDGQLPLGGVTNGILYPEGLQVDAMANVRDLLFRAVIDNRAALLISGYDMTGLPAVLFETPNGARGIWAPGNQVSQDLVDADDIVGLEVWAPLTLGSNAPNSPFGIDLLPDANRYSLLGDPLGCAVQVLGGGCLVANAPLLPFVNSLPNGIFTGSALSIDLDALMVFEDTNQILFSIRPTGGFDGGEIMVYNYVTGVGDFLRHGGHTWDTAYDVLANFGGLGMTSDDVSVLEAVATPEPGTWALLTGGAALLAGIKRRRKK